MAAATIITTTAIAILIILVCNFESNNSSSSHNQSTEVSWDNISKIGDIILVAGRREVMSTSDSGTDATVTNRSGNKKCSSCGYQNQEDAVFCEECGNKLG
jgi:methionyl-tRNA synthetase